MTSFAQKTIQCKYHFASNQDYPLLFGEDYILKVDVGWTTISLYLNLKEHSEKILVCGPSAIDANTVKPPFFHRWSWANRFGCSTIVISDPTLETGKFNIGWFLGKKNEYLLTKCSNIINKIISQLGIERNSTIFYGSSAGGFSSLMMASYFKGANVIVQNPQIDVRRYHGEFYSALIKSNFNGAEPEEEKLNVISLFRKVAYIPNIYYVQNVYDNHHYDIHLPIFMSGISELRSNVSNQFKLHIELDSDKQKGHDADAFEKAVSRLQNAFIFFYGEDFIYQ
ncbi:hypothetical protein ACEUCM_00755 [Aeromonas dhakensis]|uniref:hypothetical protein n=1 Tax=Aeromonas dhakensis TaxID=196024 RepID=UPI0038D23EFF